MRQFQVKLGKTVVPIRTKFNDTMQYFGSFVYADLSLTEEQDDWVCATSEAFAFWTRTGKAMDAQAECSILSLYCSDYLLGNNSCVFHAVAFTHHGKAFLITAPPGIGKSTQIRYLQSCYPNEFEIISGDRPILQKMLDDSFLVYPSPWNGKENWHGANEAPLSGIICLERGNENRIERLSPKKSILPLLPALMCSRTTEELVTRMAAFEEAIIKNVPIWKLINQGVPGSTHLLYETVFASEEHDT